MPSKLLQDMSHLFFFLTSMLDYLASLFIYTILILKLGKNNFTLKWFPSTEIWSLR